MARITIDDALDSIDNHFDLVLIAAKRARQLYDGAEPTIERAKDKPTVLALREIAEKTINLNTLNEE